MSQFQLNSRGFACLILLTLAFSLSCSKHQDSAQNSPPVPVPSGSRTLAGQVIRVADGDTITVLDAANTQHRIRLQGIDAPESHQAFGAQSKKNLSGLVFGKDVTVLYDKTDQYGRLVGKIVLDGRDVNLEQVKAGLAWHYKEYEREQSAEDREAYARAEDAARQARRGLWRDPDPVEPSAFRREEKAK